MSSWVQYKNDPNGQKWELADTQPDMYGDVEWIVKSKGYDIYHYLPKSEFVPCDPPEQWEDVTERVDYCGNLAFAHRKAGKWGDVIVTDDGGYRFTKIDGMHNGPAFIVERKRS